MSKPLTFLCVATFYKGIDFIRTLKALGNRVLVVTKKSLEHEPWPRESIDEIFYLEHDNNAPENMATLLEGLAWVMRSNRIDRIVSLDDFDVEKAAFLREEFRIPGMGQTTAKHFRDKLAMRMKAAEAGIPVPPFSAVFNDEEVTHYLNTVPGPWVIKPRSEASAIGIKKVHNAHDAWQVLHEIGAERHLFLIEQYKPGDVYHADAISNNGKTVFCRVSRYLAPPLDVAHGGGVFRTHTVEFGGEEDKALQKLTAQVMDAFGMRYSASHTEFIRSREDGKYYFLETSCRVGGAHISEMVEYSSDINLWTEWAKVEDAQARGTAYTLPAVANRYAGLIVSLSRYTHPDYASFTDPELAWRLQKDQHIGLIVTSDSRERVLELLDRYTERIFEEFHASLPPKDKALT
ncbi:MAG: ATP-grasp domain-containing protein [Saprospiraceae bacterium]|nr:ATP-grasp domain-containing protein [Saprospiraceae bacterium]